MHHFVFLLWSIVFKLGRVKQIYAAVQFSQRNFLCSLFDWQTGTAWHLDFKIKKFCTPHECSLVSLKHRVFDWTIRKNKIMVDR